MEKQDIKKEGNRNCPLYKIEKGIVGLLIFWFIFFLLAQFTPISSILTPLTNPAITGFVSIEMKTQSIDIFVEKSKNFILSTEKAIPFNLTSLRLSGKIEGEGHVEIILVNGMGQQLTVFSNIREKREVGNLITTLTVKNDDELNRPQKSTEEETWLLVTPGEGYTANIPRILGPNEETFSGGFAKKCGDTCYMWMPMDKGKAYKFIVRTDPGTEVNINEIIYTIET